MNSDVNYFPGEAMYAKNSECTAMSGDEQACQNEGCMFMRALGFEESKCELDMGFTMQQVVPADFSLASSFDLAVRCDQATTPGMCLNTEGCRIYEPKCEMDWTAYCNEPCAKECGTACRGAAACLAGAGSFAAAAAGGGGVGHHHSRGRRAQRASRCLAGAVIRSVRVVSSVAPTATLPPPCAGTVEDDHGKCVQDYNWCINVCQATGPPS